MSSIPPAVLALRQDIDSFAEAEQFIREADLLSRPQELLDRLATMPAIFAVAVMIVGGVCIFQGYRWHRWIVVVLALMLGLVVGDIVSDQIGRSSVVAIAMGLLFAAVASPMLKYTVAVFAGLAGAFLGANVWSLVQGAEAGQPWPGAAMGFILLALLSFLIFRISIILFTSLGGAAMLVIGGIACLLHVEAVRGAVEEHLAQHQLIVPMLVGVAAVVGFVLQENWTRSGPAVDEE
ncbi:MAG: hypothetical protein ACYTFH_09845 [Planctomycetota bacterium]|jgi:hypothetical protein